MKFFKPKKTIYREENVPLLYRWTIFECSWFAIKIHKLVSSDNACMHDHPWASIGFLLNAGYVEFTPDEPPILGHGEIKEKSRVRSRFSLIYRSAYFVHRLEIHQPVYTLFITFKKVRKWGFWNKQGWIEWFKYNPQKNICE